MKELFSKLHRYRTRDSQNSNLEDWLTECLAAVLRSFSCEQWRAVLTRLANWAPEEAVAAIEHGLPRVETQVEASHFGRPDVVIYVNDSPTIVIENKVAHSVAGATAGTGEPINQLQRYAEWLKANYPVGVFQPTLVFLTHLTPPPPNFEGSIATEETYHFVRRVVQSWGEAGRLFLVITQDMDSSSLSRGLAEAFYGMLEAQDMQNEFPDTTDIAASQLFLAHGSTVENLINKMWEKVAPAANSSNMSGKILAPQIEFGCYSAFRYVNKPAVMGCYPFIETGLWFPGVGHGWETSELEEYRPAGPQLFLLYGADDDDEFSHIEGRPTTGWLRPKTNFLVLRSLQEFEGTPDHRASAILEWLGQESANLRSFLLEKRLN